LQPADLPESLRQEETHVDLVNGRLPGTNLKAALANPEKQLILDALNAHGWNRQETSDFLGINRTTLYKKMKRYGISFEQQLLGT
jgi:two-component system, NtrC family, response regulator HydG